MESGTGNDGKRGDGRMSGAIIVVLVGAVAALILGGIPLLSHLYSLNIQIPNSRGRTARNGSLGNETGDWGDVSPCSV